MCLSAVPDRDDAGVPREIGCRGTFRSFIHVPLNILSNAMTDHTTKRSSSFRSFSTTDEIRSAVLLAATQVMIALLGAILITSSGLA